MISLKSGVKLGLMKKILFEHPWKSAFFPYVVIPVIFLFDLPRGSVFDDIDFIFLLIGLILIILFPIWLIFGLVVSKKKLPYILSILIGLLILFIIIYISYLGFLEVQCGMHPSKC